jgi:hypothetical protein
MRRLLRVEHNYAAATTGRNVGISKNPVSRKSPSIKEVRWYRRSFTVGGRGVASPIGGSLEWCRPETTPKR